MTPAKAQEKLEDLEKRIEELEQEIAQNEAQRQAKSKEARSLQRDVNLLNSEIKQTNLKIRQTELNIKKTEQNIDQKQQEIKLLEDKISNTRAVIAEHLRAVNYYDDQSLLELFLKEERLSGIFDAAAGLEAIQDRLHDNLDKLRAGKEISQKQKQELEEQHQEQNDLQRLQVAQKQTVDKKKRKKNDLLSKTKEEEALYNKEISKNRGEIANIRAKIRLLQSGGRELSFEEAVDLVKYAESLTGVKASLILSVLYQESTLGQNLGTAYYKDAIINFTSDWRKKQREAFEQIIRELGRDPETTLVSRPPCFTKGCGSGGAMGPAQFMPTTWLSYRDDVKNLVGHIPDPWDIKDALIAMALLLKDNGGSKDPWRAAAAYFGSCRGNWAFYCKKVVARADCYKKTFKDPSINYCEGQNLG